MFPDLQNWPSCPSIYQLAHACRKAGGKCRCEAQARHPCIEIWHRWTIGQIPIKFNLNEKFILKLKTIKFNKKKWKTVSNGGAGRSSPRPAKRAGAVRRRGEGVGPQGQGADPHHGAEAVAAAVRDRRPGRCVAFAPAPPSGLSGAAPAHRNDRGTQCGTE